MVLGSILAFLYVQKRTRLHQGRTCIGGMAKNLVFTETMIGLDSAHHSRVTLEHVSSKFLSAWGRVWAMV